MRTLFHQQTHFKGESTKRVPRELTIDKVTAELSVWRHWQSWQEALSDFVGMTANLSSQLLPDEKQIYVLYRNSSVILLLQNLSAFRLVLSLFIHVYVHFLLIPSPELRKTTIRFVMSVCLSVRQLGFHWTDFRDFYILEFFGNIPRKFSV